MPQIEGSLSKRVLDIVRFGNWKVAGMVIDEQGADHEKTKEQMIMLRKLAVWRCPIFLVEFETESDRLALRRPLPTKPELRLAACDDTLEDFSPPRTQLQCRRVTKRYANALVQTDLMKKLKADNITHVVIMGSRPTAAYEPLPLAGKTSTEDRRMLAWCSTASVCSARPS
jgi:hypothetical protein